MGEAEESAGGGGRGSCHVRIQITKPVLLAGLSALCSFSHISFPPRPLRAQGRPHPPRVRGGWGPGNGAQKLQLLWASSQLLTVPRVSCGLCSATWAPVGREQIPEQKDWKQRLRGQRPSWEGALRGSWFTWEFPGSNHPQPPSPGPAPMGDRAQRCSRPGLPRKPLATGKLLGKVCRALSLSP